MGYESKSVGNVDLARKVLQELVRLREGATVCPGELARRCGTTQAGLRPVLAALVRQRVAGIFQRGRAADLDGLKGPYRVGRWRDSA